MNTYKPEGYNSLAPYLVVDDARGLANFMKEAFGAEELRMYERPDGTLMHGELKIDDSVIMISQANERYPASQHLLHLYVPDADDAFIKAINSGGKSLQPPVAKDDQDKRGMFMDPAGNTWAISNQT